MSSPNRAYVSGDHSVATPISAPLFSAPFADKGIITEYVLTQDWQQDEDDFAPLALDTAHPDFEEFLLAKEDNKRSLGGGMIAWTRTYIKLPAAFERQEGDTVYEFPGFSGLVYGGFVGFGGSADGRVAESRTVQLYIERTFYNTDDPDTDIPRLDAFAPYYAASFNKVKYLNDDETSSYDDTVPSRTAYEAMITAEDKLDIRDSENHQWMGNFWIRERFQVKAR